MARKHPVSPNQTVLWTWHSLSPAWGSRALREPQETRKSPRRATKNSSRTTGGKTHAKATTKTDTKITARPSTGRQTSSRVRTQRDATGRNGTQRDATSKNELVSAGAEGDSPRPPEPGLKNYDIFIYGTAAALVFNKVFFPDSDPAIGTLLAVATFGVWVRGAAGRRVHPRPRRRSLRA